MFNSLHVFMYNVHVQGLFAVSAEFETLIDKNNNRIIFKCNESEFWDLPKACLKEHKLPNQFIDTNVCVCEIKLGILQVKLKFRNTTQIVFPKDLIKHNAW